MKAPGRRHSPYFGGIILIVVGNCHAQNVGVATAGVSIAFANSGPNVAGAGVSIGFANSGPYAIGRGVSISFANAANTAGRGVSIAFGASSGPTSPPPAQTSLGTS